LKKLEVWEKEAQHLVERERERERERGLVCSTKSKTRWYGVKHSWKPINQPAGL
jgi:hypothetical protein